MLDETHDQYYEILGGKEPLEKLDELALTINENYYNVGCILYNLKESDTYKTIDGNVYYSDKHNKWKQFCEDKLSISYRTAQYWLNLYRYFTEMGISREKLQSLSWSKAKELIDVTEDVTQLDILITKAEEMNIVDLRAYVADFKAKEDTDEEAEVVHFKKFNFTLPEAQSEHAQELLKSASLECNGNLNEGFWKILMEWSHYTHPLTEAEQNTYLVSDNDLDDAGQELPEELRELFN